MIDIRSTSIAGCTIISIIKHIKKSASSICEVFFPAYFWFFFARYIGDCSGGGDRRVGVELVVVVMKERQGVTAGVTANSRDFVRARNVYALNSSRALVTSHAGQDSFFLRA